MENNKNKELTLKEIQNGSFQVLLKLKEIFDDNGWKYYLICGTLIGAVRHKGFIPWDDDIDLWIPRPDYEKFIDYCIENKEKLYPYELIHYKTNDKYIYPIARFSDSRYKVDYTNAKDYGLGLFVDLYPLDGFEEKDKLLWKKLTFNKKLICLCGSKSLIKTDNKIKNILKIPYYNLVKKMNINKLLRKNDKLSKKRSFEKSKRFECMSWAEKRIGHDKKVLEYPKELFMEFNNHEFRVPSGYDKVLKEIYGDYMSLPPEEERIAHHFYKVYKK